MSAERHSPEPPQPNPSAESTSSDRAALIERLFREHNEALIRFLQVRLHSRQEASEVAQEAYVRLLSLDEPGAVSYLRAFLFKTAANLAVDRMRRGQVHVRATELTALRNFADARTPERSAAGKQALERLGRLIAAMPPKCRHAFVLHRFHGRDITSIAREMNIAERTVRAYVERALLQCRAALDMEQGNE
jgi:RNA polymerase sigma factor (sigma-70 family)